MLTSSQSYIMGPTKVLEIIGLQSVSVSMLKMYNVIH